MTRRALPALGALAAGALCVGAVVGAVTHSEAGGIAERFARAWARADYAAMHALLTPTSRARTPAPALERAYRRAMATATATGLRAEAAGERDGARRLRVVVDTRVFGPVSGEVLLPVRDDGVAWAPHLVFPGLREGATLGRRTEAPPRASILARGGETIAEGPAAARVSPLGAVGTAIAGRVGPPETDAARRALRERGFPQGTPVGLSGLELIVEQRVAGMPGGTLLAGDRVLAISAPRPAPAVRTTIDAQVQAAAVTALAGRFGGIAAIDARTAQIRALAGVAFSAPQPPGSTFKIITATAALEEKLVTASTRFPIETKAVIDGVDLENANGESCGGTFANSFAHSCNSVFAPLGVRLGARRLVETAERYGFNEAPGIAGAKPSTIPAARDIRTPLDAGATAIGQGKVLATPLELAIVAHTVASGGVRRAPRIVADAPRPRGVRVTSRRIARTLERLMIGVVDYGTGTRASLAPVKVAGKTGTAELEDTTDQEPEVDDEPPGFDTDAWFTAYAPIRRPRLAVAVLFVRAGAGGDTAAPAARTVLQAGLR